MFQKLHLKTQPQYLVLCLFVCLFLNRACIVPCSLLSMPEALAGSVNCWGLLVSFSCKHILNCGHCWHSIRHVNSHFLILYFLQVISIKLDTLFVVLFALWQLLDTKEARCRVARKCLITFFRKKEESLGKN